MRKANLDQLLRAGRRPAHASAHDHILPTSNASGYDLFDLEELAPHIADIFVRVIGYLVEFRQTGGTAPYDVDETLIRKIRASVTIKQSVAMGRQDQRRADLGDPVHLLDPGDLHFLGEMSKNRNGIDEVE